MAVMKFKFSKGNLMKLSLKSGFCCALYLITVFYSRSCHKFFFVFSFKPEPVVHCEVVFFFVKFLMIKACSC